MGRLRCAASSNGSTRRAPPSPSLLTCGVETTAAQSPAPVRREAAAFRNLITATVGFTLTFWAWNLVSPLSGAFKDRLDLSSFQQSLLVAVPVLVGSLGRVPAGALTDRFGAKLMFPLVSALTVVPVLLLIPAKDNYAAMLAVGFLLGLGGTTFAIGIPWSTRGSRPRNEGWRWASSAWGWAESRCPDTSRRGSPSTT